MILNSQHFHAVCQDKPLKAQLFPQKPCDHPPGHGAGQTLRLQLREKHMTHHDGGNPGLNGPPEGNQLQSLQFFFGFVHPGQPQVTVHRRIAVTGEVFGTAQHAAVGIGGQRSAAEGGNGIRIIPEAAHTDNRIACVGIHVQYRGHVEICPQSLQLPDGDLGGQTGVFGVPRGGQCHGAGDVDGILRQTADHAALLVNDDKGGIAGFFQNELPDFCAQLPQLCGGFHVAQEENHISDFVFPNQGFEFRGQGGSVETENQLLSQHFFQSHFSYSFG